MENELFFVIRALLIDTVYSNYENAIKNFDSSHVDCSLFESDLLNEAGEPSCFARLVFTTAPSYTLHNECDYD